MKHLRVVLPLILGLLLAACAPSAGETSAGQTDSTPASPKAAPVETSPAPVEPEGPPPPEDFVESTFDEFTGSYDTVLEPSVAYSAGSREISLGAIRTLDLTIGAELLPHNEAFFWVTYLADDWAFIESAILLINGERFPMSNGQSSRDVFAGGRVYESVLFSVKKDVMKRIGEAKDLKMRVANSDFVVTPVLQQRFMAFHATMLSDEKKAVAAAAQNK